ncbi:MAG: hypothetical protein IPL32_18960 [Chloracidobacterium sp.]|nr:hypothetical protein [Chloracidobacterium sp.]
MSFRYKLELVSEQGNPKTVSAIASASEEETLAQAKTRVKQVVRKIYDNYLQRASTDEEFTNALIEEKV